MRTYLLRVFVVVGLLLVWAIPAVSGDRVYRPNRNNDPGEVIYNIVVPWPFRSGTTTERAAAVASPAAVREQLETQLLDTGIIRTTRVHFETGKADLTPDSRRVLDEVARIFLDWPVVKIEISGHCDKRGTVKFNQELSEKRANAVRDYLVKRYPKIRARSLTAVGFGKGKPIAPNTTVEGMAKNRRVEFKVLNEEELAREIERRRSEGKVIGGK